jgi:hypothetical protein
MNDKLTADRLRQVASYDPKTGRFTWLQARRKCSPGAEAGNVEKNRYVRIKIDYCLYYAHRLAWLYMTGAWPENQIDHKNNNKSDNRWENLREATQKQNSQNWPAKLTGRIGVSMHKRSGLWRARIRIDGVEHSLGYFKTVEAAASAREAAETRLCTHAKVCEPQSAYPYSSERHE